MCQSHIGDDAVVGLGDIHQRVNLARVVGAHLHHGHVVLLAQSQQGAWHADVVVEVALCVECAVFPCQHGSHQLLRGGLAVGACDAYDGCGELSAVMPCQLLHRGQHVVAAQVAFVSGRYNAGIVHHGIGAALLQRCGGIAVAVEAVALQGEEEAAGGAMAAVGGDDGVMQIDVVKLLYCHG